VRVSSDDLGVARDLTLKIASDGLVIRPTVKSDLPLGKVRPTWHLALDPNAFTLSAALEAGRGSG
jgi:hypothetical protein